MEYVVAYLPEGSMAQVPAWEVTLPISRQPPIYFGVIYPDSPSLFNCSANRDMNYRA